MGGRDDAVLRFGLGNAYLRKGEFAHAIAHLQRAVEQDETYSAAWKLLGRAHAATGDTAKAAEAYKHGLRVAEQRGDVQAVKEMRVFLRRLPATGNGA